MHRIAEIVGVAAEHVHPKSTTDRPGGFTSSAQRFSSGQPKGHGTTRFGHSVER